MNLPELLAALDIEIERLTTARNIIASGEAGKRRGRPLGSGRKKDAEDIGTPAKRRVLSAEARARIVAAQKARWAKQKKAAG